MKGLSLKLNWLRIMFFYISPSPQLLCICFTILRFPLNSWYVSESFTDLVHNVWLQHYRRIAPLERLETQLVRPNVRTNGLERKECIRVTLIRKWIQLGLRWQRGLSVTVYNFFRVLWPPLSRSSENSPCAEDFLGFYLINFVP